MVQSYLPNISAELKIGSINYNIFRYVWIFLFVTSAMIIRQHSQADTFLPGAGRDSESGEEFVEFLLLSLWW